MFDMLFKALGSDFGNFREVVAHLHDLSGYFVKDYMKDGNARDAAIDAMVDYLQTLKSQNK